MFCELIRSSTSLSQSSHVTLKENELSEDPALEWFEILLICLINKGKLKDLFQLIQKQSSASSNSPPTALSVGTEEYFPLHLGVTAACKSSAGLYEDQARPYTSTLTLAAASPFPVTYDGSDKTLNRHGRVFLCFIYPTLS